MIGWSNRSLDRRVGYNGRWAQGYRDVSMVVDKDGERGEAYEEGLRGSREAGWVLRDLMNSPDVGELPKRFEGSRAPNTVWVCADMSSVQDVVVEASRSST